MALNIFKHQKHKTALIIITSLVAVVLILAFVVNQYWEPILSKKVKNAVLSGTDSLYTINFSSVELHVLEGRVVLYNITIKPDTAVYNRRLKQHAAPNNLFQLHVKRLVLSHIHPFKLYFKHQLDIDRITLSSPEVKMSYRLNHKKDTVTDNRTAWQKMSKTLKMAHVNDIFLDDVNFKYDDYSGNKLVISELKEMNLHASNLLIDSATQTDRSRLLYCKDIVTELNNYKGKTASGLYTYIIKKLTLSTRTSQLNITGFTLDPINTGLFFSRSQKDKYNVKLDSIQLNNFDFLTYHKYRTLSASSLIVNGGWLNLFNNPNKPQTNKDKILSFPNAAIYRLKSDIKIDTILVGNVDIGYSEHNKKSDQTGTITFNNTKARLLNFTTNAAALKKNNLLTINATTYFMGSGKLNVFFAFNLTATDNAYSYSGNLGPMNLQRLNPAIMPFAMVKVTSGKLNAFNFNIKANRKIAKGSVTMRYNDLKVNLLKADTANQQLKKKFIESLFANIFIVKHNNPDNPGEIPRSFNVSYTRPINFPFFKTVWNTLLTGIKPAVGYDIKTQRAATAKMAQKDLNKQNKEMKKAFRKQKRAERKRKRQLRKELKEAEKNKEGKE